MSLNARNKDCPSFILFIFVASLIKPLAVSSYCSRIIYLLKKFPIERKGANSYLIIQTTNLENIFMCELFDMSPYPFIQQAVISLLK